MGDAGSSDVGGGIGDEGDVGDGDVGDGSGVVMSTLRSPLPCNRKQNQAQPSGQNKVRAMQKKVQAGGRKAETDRHHRALQQGESISALATRHISDLLLPQGR